MLANHKGEIPFVILLLPFLAGIGLALYLPGFASSNVAIFLLICLSTVFILLNISYKYTGLYKHQWLGGVVLHCILFCAAWVVTTNYNDLNKADHFSKYSAQYLSVKISNEPVIKNGSIRFVGAVTKGIDSGKHLSTSGKLLISIKDSSAFNLSYGDALLIPATYNEVEPPYNPGEFNYKQYLANQNIYHQTFLYPGQYVVADHNTGNPLIAYSLLIRKKLVARLNTVMHDSSAIAVASTMLLGYKADLSDEVMQAYANTGTLHVLSVSGAHVAIVFILLSWGLSFLNRVKYGKAVKTLLIITLIWAYALLTGFSPAANRAALMIILIIGGNASYRYINPLNLLAASAFALLVYNPYYLTDVGFQLSYLAVGGLIVFQPILYNTLIFENKWIDKLWKLCSVSIAAQVITFPLSAYYFHQFPVYFLLSNLFILLPVLAIMYVGIAFLIFSGVPLVSTALAYLLEKSIDWMNKGLALIQHLPYASFNKLWIGKTDYLLMYAVIILLFYFMFNRKKLLLNLSLALTLMLFINLGWKSVNAENIDAITFLNLKKNRVIIFKKGPDAVVLSDIAPTDKNYRYSVQPGLDSAKIKNVRLYSFSGNFQLPYLKKTANLIQFKSKIILLMDSSSKNLSLKHPVKTDVVFISNSVPVSVKKIKDSFAPDLIVVSANNNDRYIDTLKKQLLATGGKHYVLKRNKALNLASQ